MSTDAPHNVAIAVLFALLGGMLVLSVAPYEIGTIRLAGVSLLWWYGGLALPVATATVVIATLAGRDAPRPAPAPARDATPASE